MDNNYQLGFSSIFQSLVLLMHFIFMLQEPQTTEVEDALQKHCLSKAARKFFCDLKWKPFPNMDWDYGYYLPIRMVVHHPKFNIARTIKFFYHKNHSFSYPFSCVMFFLQEQPVFVSYIHFD